MIAITKSSHQPANVQHDGRFLEMVPAIQRDARSAFRNLRTQAREEAISAVVTDAFFAFRRLVELSKQDVAYATPLARFAVRRYWTGRCACMPRGRDMMSHKAGTTHGIVVERLDVFDADQCKWRQALVEDRHAGPAEIAASRLDVAAWLRSLPRRDRRVAETLSLGHTTSEAARRFGVSRARVSQLRRSCRPVGRRSRVKRVGRLCSRRRRIPRCPAEIKEFVRWRSAVPSKGSRPALLLPQTHRRNPCP